MRADYKTTGLQGITDLTVLARIKTDFVPGAFDTVTYVERLRRALRVLNAVRQASREASLQPSPFADPVGRFRGIHFFRFAVVPSGDVPGRYQLLLNVTFDGGWEPYIRLIWGPLGMLLDLIFCHCEGYPLAFYKGFDDYVRWVRDHEVPSSFFYADSAATVADLHYLRQLEEQQRNDGGRHDADAKAAGLALPAQPATTIPSAFAVTTSLRVLKALDTLRELFPAVNDDKTQPPFQQDGVLLRFTQDLLRDLRGWVAQGLFDPGQPFDQLRAIFKLELDWLMTKIERRPEVPEKLKFSRSNVQAGIDRPYPADVTHGVLVLLRVKDAKKTRQWLASVQVTTGDANAPDGGIYRSLALTYTGLQRLGVPRDALDRFPHEFIEGMEKRAGVLGDLRGNHPEQWRRPQRNWPWPGQNQAVAGSPIELSTVHVLMQLRTALKPSEADTDGAVPLPRLAVAVDALNDVTKTGLQVLCVQPMKLGARPTGAPAGRDHFGFVDGISQPTLTPLVPAPSYWNDQVKPGELFLGYSNSRGDKAPQNGERPGLLLDNGSFVVVRKLRQFPERLDTLLSDAAKRLKPNSTPNAQNTLREDIKAKMMGRRTDGTPLVKFRGSGSNDFDYRSDSHGAQCPFQSHIRRANPREPLPLQLPPRIARRGMSYGPQTEGATDEPRGLIFMAYNASIAEQFEVIQRWLAGGNSSGLSSAQNDPLLGVPEAGQRRAYRFEHDGKVMRVDLGEQPLVQLEWGLYAFVPSIAALREISAIVDLGSSGPVVDAPPLPSPLPSELKAWRLLLEDDNVRARTWEAVRRDHGGVLNADGYGLLVGSKDKVLEVLKDDGGKFSVKGYGERMKMSIGHGFLGMDDVKPDDGHQDQAPHVNKIIEKFVSEEDAFNAARYHASEYLKTLLDRSQALTGKREALVDLIEFGRSVLASLCSDWFGLPDEVLMKYAPKADDRLQDDVARCPGHLLTVSRYIFAPHPRVPVEVPAKKHGDLVLKAVKALLKEAREGQRKLTPLVNDIVSSQPLRGNVDLQARTVAGVMLGFPPTVFGNLVTVLVAWTGSMKLWEFQQELLQAARDDPSAKDLLREAFLKTMSAAPVPYAIWRTAATDRPLEDPTCKKDDIVVVGLGSAVADGGDSMLMFGGERNGEHKTTHACPGYAMAMGVMLGCVTALLTAGELRRTADPRVLTLRAA